MTAAPANAIGMEQVPFPGLRAFTRDESYLFFGRDNCVTELIDKLAQSRFLAVLGSSGSGKSSLVRTGLLEYLELGLHPAGSDWMVIDFHPAGDPIGSLAAGLFQAQGMEVKDEEFELLAHSLRRGPRAVIEWCQAGHLPEGRNLLLLADQFEELFRFSSYAEREEAEAFARLLIESSESPDFPISVCLTMRTEFLSDCAMIPGLAERINDGLFLTPRMTRDECEEAIVGPAGVAGFEVEPKLANQLLNDMATLAPWEDKDDASQTLARRADQLPLMQHVLNQLYLETHQASDGEPLVLRRDHYQRIGGLTGALDVHGMQVLERLGALPPDPDAPPANAEAGNVRRTRGEVDFGIVGKVFRALVAGPSIAKAVRRPCRFDQLAQAAGDEQAARTVVDAFRAHGVNFLRPYEGEPLANDTIVDISHESLIRQWSLLTRWFEQEREAGVAWDQLRMQQEAYAEGRSDLLSGLALANLSEFWETERPTAGWAARHGGDYVAIETFYAKSREAAERERAEAEAEQLEEQRRLRRRVVVMGALAGVAMLFGLGSFLGYRYASEAQEAAVAAQDAALKSQQEALAAADAQRIAADKATAAETVAETERAAALASASEAERAALAQQEAAARATASEQQAQANLADARAAQAAAEAARRQAEEQADANVELIRRIGEAITVGGGAEEVTGDELRDEVRERLPDQSSRSQDRRGGSGSPVPLALAFTLPLAGEGAAASVPVETARETTPGDPPCRTEWQLIAQIDPQQRGDRLPGSLQTQCLARELAQFFDAQLARSAQMRTQDRASDLQINALLGNAWFAARNWKESIAAYERAYDAGSALSQRELLGDRALLNPFLEASYNWLFDAAEVAKSGKAQAAFLNLESLANTIDLSADEGPVDLVLATNLARFQYLRMQVYRYREPDDDQYADAAKRLFAIADLIVAQTVGPDAPIDSDRLSKEQLDAVMDGLSLVTMVASSSDAARSEKGGAELACSLHDQLNSVARFRLDKRTVRAALNCAQASLREAGSETLSESDVSRHVSEALDRAGQVLEADPFDERIRLARLDLLMASAGRLRRDAQAIADTRVEAITQHDSDLGSRIDELRAAEEERLASRGDGSGRGERRFEPTAEMLDIAAERSLLQAHLRRLASLSEKVTSEFGSNQQAWLYCDPGLVRSVERNVLPETGDRPAFRLPGENPNDLLPETQLSDLADRCLTQINLARSDFSRILAQSSGKALRRWNSTLFADIGWNEWAQAQGGGASPAEVRRDFVNAAIEVGLVTLRDLPGSFDTLNTLYQIVKRDDGGTNSGLIDDGRALGVTDAALTHIMQGEGLPTFWDRDVVNLGCRMHTMRLDLLETADLSRIREAGLQLRDYCQDVADDRIWAAYTRNALRSSYSKLAQRSDLLSTETGFRTLYPFIEWASETGSTLSTRALLRHGEDYLSDAQLTELARRRELHSEPWGFEYTNHFGNDATWYFWHSENPMWSGEAYAEAMDRYNRAIGPDSAKQFLVSVSRMARKAKVPMPSLAESILKTSDSYLASGATLEARYAIANQLVALDRPWLPVDANGVAFGGYLPGSIRAGAPEKPEVARFGYSYGGLYAVDETKVAAGEDWPAFNGFDPTQLAKGRLVAGSPHLVATITDRGGGRLSTFALFSDAESRAQWEAAPAETMMQAADQWTRLTPDLLHPLADRERLWALPETIIGNRDAAVASAIAALNDAGDGSYFSSATFGVGALALAPERTPTNAEGFAFAGAPIEDLTPDGFDGGSSEGALVYRGAKVRVSDDDTYDDLVKRWPIFNGWDPVELASGRFVAGVNEFVGSEARGEDPRSFAIFSSPANRERWLVDNGELYEAAREQWLTNRPDYRGDLPRNDAQILAAADFAQAAQPFLPDAVPATLSLSQSIRESDAYQKAIRDNDVAKRTGAADPAALAGVLAFDGRETPIGADGFAFGGHSVWALESGEVEAGDRRFPLFYRSALVATRDDEDMFNVQGAWPVFNGWDPVELAGGRWTAGRADIHEIREKYGFERPVLFASEASRTKWEGDRTRIMAGALDAFAASGRASNDELTEELFDFWELEVSQRLIEILPGMRESERVELAYETVWDIRETDDFAAIDSQFEEGNFAALPELIEQGIAMIAPTGQRTPLGADQIAFEGYLLPTIADDTPEKAEDGDEPRYYRSAFYYGNGLLDSQVRRMWPAFNGWDPVALADGRFEAGKVAHVFTHEALGRPVLFASAESLARFEADPAEYFERALLKWPELLPQFASDIEDMVDDPQTR